MRELFAGSSHADITPHRPVWMDGMIRAHPSEGVHDPISARALVFSNSLERRQACAVVSVEVCALARQDADLIRREIERRIQLPRERIMVCATHGHSGPATLGFFNPREEEYTRTMCAAVVDAVERAALHMAPAVLESGLTEESGISQYRRLLADDGRVVMNWEPFPPERIRGPLGESDPDVVAFRFREAGGNGGTIAAVLHHAGHPNTLSGDNYLISSEYPGLACRLIEQRWGGEALYLNGAQGSVDIDNFRDRGWDGLERLGTALAAAAAKALENTAQVARAEVRAAHRSYAVKARRIARRELSWADEVLRKTGGAVHPVADGVGDDYKASLYRRMHEAAVASIDIEQVAFILGDAALVSFPGELYTEIGSTLKRRSPFAITCPVGLANGYVGYVPTRKAIREGGYAEETRGVDASAAGEVLRQSVALLHSLRRAVGG
jgi:neutral ceramidase